MLASATVQFELPRGLLVAVCYVESHHKTNAVHKDDGNSPSIGLCQVKLSTARMLGYKGSEKGLINPATNVHFAAKYLAYQFFRYKGDIVKAIASYNSGTYKEVAPGLPINQPYVNKVFKAWPKNK